MGRQLHDRPTGRALSAARLADHTERLAAQHVEADAADGVDLQPGTTDRELDDEIFDPQQNIALGTEMGLAGARHQAATSASRCRRAFVS